MAKRKTYTQSQIQDFGARLAELPDLSKEKISTAEALLELKEQIVDLANKRGYSPSEIKNALEGVGMTVTVKAISDILGSQKKRRFTSKMPAKAD